jgi:hypothetical protein
MHHDSKVQAGECAKMAKCFEKENMQKKGMNIIDINITSEEAIKDRRQKKNESSEEMPIPNIYDLWLFALSS